MNIIIISCWVIEEELDCFEDLKELRAAKAEEANAPTSPLASVRKELKI